MKSYAKGIESGFGNRSFERVIQRVVENRNLSRREAQVALCCVEGLTNAEIGSRLLVSEQTVKFHLRHIFIKFGVKRRAELISVVDCCDFGVRRLVVVFKATTALQIENLMPPRMRGFPSGYCVFPISPLLG